MTAIETMTAPGAHENPAERERVATEMLARQHAWELRRDPRALWPDVDPAMIQPAGDELGRVMAALLDGRHPSLGRADGGDARALGVAGLASGVGPLIGYHIETGELDASEPAARIFATHLAHGRARMRRVRNGVVPVMLALEKAGLAPAVMKGFHTAHAYFPDSGTRPLSDVDLVVAPENIASAEALLRAAGFHGASLAGGPHKRNWTPPDVTEHVESFDLWHERNPWKLELHEGVNFDHVVKFGGSVAIASHFTREWSGAGVALRVPGQPALVSMLAVHTSGELYSSRLLRIVELVLVARRDMAAGILDWRAVEDFLLQTGRLRYTLPAFALVEQLCPGTIDARILNAAQRASTSRTRAIVRQMTPTAPLLEEGNVSITRRLMWAASPRAMLRLAGEALLPEPTASARDAIRAYHRRLYKLVTGRIALGRTGTGDDR